MRKKSRNVVDRMWDSACKAKCQYAQVQHRIPANTVALRGLAPRPVNVR